MKPFNYEEFKKGKPAQTRDGQKVWKIIDLREAPEFCDSYLEYPLVALFTKGKFVNIKENGAYFMDNSQHSFDLVMTPQKREYWAAVYKGSRAPFVTDPVFESEADVIAWRGEDDGFIKAIKIHEEEV